MAPPSPTHLISWLLGAAIGAGGILQSIHWQRTTTPSGPGSLTDQLRDAHREINALKRENESLRSLAQGGGAFAVPQEWIDHTERDFNLRFLSSPVIHRIAREELRDRISAAVESRFGPSGLDDRQLAYTLLGLLDDSHPLLAELTAVLATGVRGWFDEVSGEAWVTDQFLLENVPDQATLMRLLTRILFHQHFPPPPSYAGDDADRARTALHQGTAAGSEARHYAANARAIGFVPAKQDPEAARTFATLAPFIQGLSLFAATHGKGYADALYLAGNEKLHEAFRNPPQTTRAILDPQTPNTPPLAVDMTAFSKDTEPLGGPVLTESAGRLGLELWLASIRPPAAPPAPANPDATPAAKGSGESTSAATLAAHWVNDRYLLLPEGEADMALVWDVVVDSVNAADLLDRAARARIAAMAGTATAPSAAGVPTTAGGRHLRIARPAPTRVRFLNTTSAETAERWQDLGTTADQPD